MKHVITPKTLVTSSPCTEKLFFRIGIYCYSGHTPGDDEIFSRHLHFRNPSGQWWGQFDEMDKFSFLVNFRAVHSTVHQYSTVQYSTVQYSTVQYSTVQYSTVQYSTVQYSTVQYSTVQYSTVQYSTVQYSTVQYSTVQYSTVQYSTVLFGLST